MTIEGRDSKSWRWMTSSSLEVDRDAVAVRCPPRGEERQLSEDVTGAESGEYDVAIFGGYRYLYAPSSDDEHLIARVTRHE